MPSNGRLALDLYRNEVGQGDEDSIDIELTSWGDAPGPQRVYNMLEGEDLQVQLEERGVDTKPLGTLAIYPDEEENPFPANIRYFSASLDAVATFYRLTWTPTSVTLEHGRAVDGQELEIQQLDFSPTDTTRIPHSALHARMSLWVTSGKIDKDSGEGQRPFIPMAAPIEVIIDSFQRINYTAS